MLARSWRSYPMFAERSLCQSAERRGQSARKNRFRPLRSIIKPPMEQLQIHYVDLGVPRVSDLKSEMSIGRTEGNDLVLNHPSVSRKHARVEARENHWWILDLKST